PGGGEVARHGALVGEGALDEQGVGVAGELDYGARVLRVSRVDERALLLLLAALIFAGRRALAGRNFAAFLVTSVVEVAMKMWLPQIPLPDEISRSAGHTPLVALEYPYPYPSGHMLRSVLLLGAVFVLWKNRMGRALIFTSLVGMALSRVYMGVHWASDVIGGALLGLAGLAWAFGATKGGQEWR
ncbi:MAG: phosphatase PAP2 family protein, partial [Actinomycetota bacterium]|nr:phosphatase PAP2 family protein [Actinomycetota bacterium]